MQDIVIIGAGSIGLHIASILSKEQYNITLIDNNARKLEVASNTIDVATRYGSGTDWQLLDELMELSPNMLLALTEQDELNLVACSIAKHLGYPRTVARVGDRNYMNRMRLDFGRIFDVDYFVAPDVLVAQDILKFMLTPGSIHIENFAHGAVQMRTVAIPERWGKSEIPLKDLDLPHGIIVGLIRRVSHDEKVAHQQKYKVIFPHGNDFIYSGDEVTLIGETDRMMEINHFFGISQQKMESVVILGGSRTGINLATLLQNRKIHVRIIDKSFEKCKKLTELLPHCSVIHHDATDLNFLKAEKIGRSDLFVACTKHDEVNLMAGLLSKQVGSPEVVVMMTNLSYVNLVKELKINYVTSPRISTANHLLSQILAGKVTSLVSLYDNQAEVMEVNVSEDSQLVGVPLSELGSLLPKDFLITMIQNRGRIMIAHGNRIISPGDTVVVIASPKHSHELEKLF